LELEPPSAALLEKSKKELRETPELAKESCEKLRQLLKNDTSMKWAWDDDESLIRFLRPTHFYPESALKLLKKLAEFKKKHSDVVGNIMPADLKDIYLTTKDFLVVKNRDQDGRRILIMKLGGDWNPSKVTADHIFQLIYLSSIGAMLEPSTQINGVVVILDFEGMGMKQVTALGPAVSMRLLSYIQEAMPLRLKEVHIVNEPMVFNMVWQVFKPFIQEKLRSRIFFHKSKWESLHKHISPEVLPPQYKGKLPAYDYTLKDWYPTFEAPITTQHYKKVNEGGLTK